MILAMLGLAAGCKGGGVPKTRSCGSRPRSRWPRARSSWRRRSTDRARPYFTHAFEVEPNSAIGREALLLAADTYYLSGGSANFVQAEAKYRDFLNRFPTSDQAAYVQFQIANSLAKRMEKPDRDQNVDPQGAGGLRGADPPLSHERVRRPGPGADERSCWPTWPSTSS